MSLNKAGATRLNSPPRQIGRVTYTGVDLYARPELGSAVRGTVPALRLRRHSRVDGQPMNKGFRTQDVTGASAGLALS